MPEVNVDKKLVAKEISETKISINNIVNSSVFTRHVKSKIINVLLDDLTDRIYDHIVAPLVSTSNTKIEAPETENTSDDFSESSSDFLKKLCEQLNIDEYCGQGNKEKCPSKEGKPTCAKNQCHERLGDDAFGEVVSAPLQPESITESWSLPGCCEQKPCLQDICSKQKCCSNSECPKVATVLRASDFDRLVDKLIKETDAIIDTNKQMHLFEDEN